MQCFWTHKMAQHNNQASPQAAASADKMNVNSRCMQHKEVVLITGVAVRTPQRDFALTSRGLYCKDMLIYAKQFWTGPVSNNMSTSSDESSGVWGVQPPPPKFRRPSKIVPNSTRVWKLLKIVEFRTPTPQDVRKKGSKIKKLPRFAIVLH